MAATYDNSGQASSTSAGSTLESASFTIGSNSNRVLYVWAASGDASPVAPSAVKWGGSGGVDATQLGSAVSVGGLQWTLWRLIAPNTGSSTVYATWPSSQDARWVIFQSVYDVDQTTPNGAVATNTGSNDTPTVNVSTTSGQLVLDGMMWFSNDGPFNLTATVGANQTSRQEIEGGTIFGVIGCGTSTEVASGGTTTMSWSLSGTPSQGWGTFAFALNDYVAPATVEQTGYGWYMDDGSESTSTPEAAQNTNITVATGVNYIIRSLLQATGDPASTEFTRRFRKNGTGGWALLQAPAAPSVSWGAIGTGAGGTNSCAPSYPAAGTANGYWYYACVTGRSNTASTTVSAPSGWTLVSDSALEGGAGTWGADTGTRRVQWFKKDAITGSESGTETFAYSSGSSTASTIYASIVRVDFPVGHSITEAATTGADTTNGTGYSATGSAGLSFLADDLLLVGTAQNIDTGTQSSEAISASDVTFGTLSNRRSQAVANGNDHRHIIVSRPVSSVTGTPTSAPTYSYTISASGSGPTSFLRLRSVAPTLEIFLSSSPNISNGVATTSRLSGGTGGFTAGAINTTANGITVNIGDDNHTEIGHCVQMASGLSPGDYFELLVYDGETALDGAAARITVASAGVTGTGAVTLPVLTVAGSGSVAREGSGAVTLPSLSVSGSGAITRTGAGAITLPVLTVAGEGTVGALITGSGAVNLPALQVDGAGKRGHPGSGAIALPVLQIDGAGAPTRTGAGAITLPVLSVSGAGAVGRAGTGAITLPSLTVAGEGFRSAIGTGTITLPVLEVDGMGAVGGAIIGSGSITLPSLSVSGSGERSVIGTGSITLPALQVSGFGPGADDQDILARDSRRRGRIMLLFGRG